MEGKSNKERHFQPILIVGHPRSGTTMLASLLGRHSNIAMPPETMFFFDVFDESIEIIDHERLVDHAMQSSRIVDLGLDRQALLDEFRMHECSMQSLFESILVSYCKKSGKSRPGEKTPLHLLWVPIILNWFPEAKFVCIVRDGRDVVNSLLQVPWSHKNLYKHCFDWSRNVFVAMKLEREKPDKFKIVKYEDILYDSQRELLSICEFIGEEYQHDMLSADASSGTVPAWEAQWKEKANSGVDKNNFGKWKGLPHEVKNTINVIMNSALHVMGYDVYKSGLIAKIKCWAVSWPYAPRCRPFFSKLKWGAMEKIRK